MHGSLSAVLTAVSVVSKTRYSPSHRGFSDSSLPWLLVETLSFLSSDKLNNSYLICFAVWPFPGSCSRIHLIAFQVDTDLTTDTRVLAFITISTVSQLDSHIHLCCIPSGAHHPSPCSLSAGYTLYWYLCILHFCT